MPTYIVRAGDSGPVKIGWADDVDARVATLQTSHYEALRVIRVIDTWWHSEAQFHERFATYRLRGEWFFYCDEMMVFIPSPLEEKKELRIRHERRSILIEKLIGQASYEENRPEMMARVAKITGLRPTRISAFFYLRDHLTIHAFEIDALRCAVRDMDNQQVDERPKSGASLRETGGAP